MAVPASLHEELGALQAELRKAAQGGSGPSLREGESPLSSAGASGVPHVPPEAGLEELLQELAQALDDYAGSAEEFVAEHPLVSVLAAFALGVAVGRLMGRA